MWRWCAPPTGQAGLQADVEPFLYDMGRQLGQADLIVCRAGATTLAEITAAGKAAILIPLPTATDDHQRKNAEALAAAGAAEVLLQRDADRRRAGATDSRRSPAIATGGARMARGGARARAAGRGAGDRRSRAGAGEAGSDRRVERPVRVRDRARQNAARALRRDRRHRHERHRRAARQSRLRRQRIGREAIGGDRSAGDAGHPRRVRARRGARRRRGRRGRLVGGAADEPGGRARRRGGRFR